MCRHFTLLEDEISGFLDRHDLDIPSSFSGDVTPEKQAMMIRYDRGDLLISSGLFGLKLRDDLLLNLRFEDIRDKPRFYEIFEKNRCLLPCSIFYEMDRHRVEQGFRSDGLMFLAGIYERDRFILFTIKADDEVRFYHGRMPLCFGEDSALRYLTSSGGDIYAEVSDLKRSEVFSLSSTEQLSLF